MHCIILTLLDTLHINKDLESTLAQESQMATQLDHMQVRIVLVGSSQQMSLEEPTPFIGECTTVFLLSFYAMFVIV